MLGINFSIACPDEYSPDQSIIEQTLNRAKITGAKIEITSDIDRALKNTDFLYTDVWISMGQEEGKEIESKKKALADYKISMKNLSKCADSCLIMHCLPAHYGEEIDRDVMESKRSIIFDQAENRLHVQKAMLCSLINP